jgi:hypothetical protein
VLNYVPRAAGALILLLWLASLPLPVFATCHSGGNYTEGWSLLAYGWFGFLVLNPAWLANIGMMIVPLLLIIRGRAPIWLGIATGLIAATAWFFTDMYDDQGSIPICYRGAGYWVWLAVGALTLLAPFLRFIAPAKSAG